MIAVVVRRRRREASLEGGHDMRYGIVEGDFAVEIGLPVEGEELEVAVPAALVEAFALGVGSVWGVLGEGSWVGSSVARSGRVGAVRHGAAGGIRFGVEDGLDDFAGGVKNERVPEVARNGLFALAAFADDGLLDGLRDAMGGLVEENLEGRGVLVARVGAGDGDAQRVEGGVGAGGISKARDVDADFFGGPAGLVNVREAMRDADALLGDQRGHALDPGAVGAIIGGPIMRAVHWRGGFEDARELEGQTGVAGFLLGAGKLVAGFKIAELIFEQDHLGAEEEIFVGVI